MIEATIALGVTVLALLAVLVLVLRHGAALLEAERVRNTEERATLLQRIQAPESAVVEHAMAMPMPEPTRPVAMDDDEAQWAAQGVEPMSKDQLAEHAYMAELA